MDRQHQHVNAQLKQTWLRQIYLEFRRIQQHKPHLNLPKLVFRLAKAQQVLGCFRAHERTVEISEHLLLKYPWHVVLEVLKHELAHVCDYHRGGTCEREKHRPHGRGFQYFAEQLELQPWARQACIDLTQVSTLLGEQPVVGEAARILRRVERLLQLASSDNAHEASAATAKAQQLMRDYHFNQLQQGFPTPYVRRQVRVGACRVPRYLQRIAALLTEYFFVDVISETDFDVYQGREVASFAIIGRKEHAKIAEYVYIYLSRHLLAEWQQEKKRRNWKGLAARNSFLDGAVAGFENQLQTAACEKKSMSDPRSSLKSRQQSLIFRETESLRHFVKSCFPQLRVVRSSAFCSVDREIYAHGFEEGKKLRLRPGVAQQKKQSPRRIQELS